MLKKSILLIQPITSPLYITLDQYLLPASHLCLRIEASKRSSHRYRVDHAARPEEIYATEWANAVAIIIRSRHFW